MNSDLAYSSYPVALNLAGNPCLVVGGGTLATEKVDGLVLAKADITVVSPAATPKIHRLAQLDAIRYRQRSYRASDLDGVYLAYGAGEDRRLNAQVAGDARAAGILVNAVDDIPNCDFFAMAISRHGDLQVAVSTNGQSPALARWTREFLDQTLPAEMGELLSLLSKVRRDIKRHGPIPEYVHWKEAIQTGLQTLAYKRESPSRSGRDGSGSREAEMRIRDTLAQASATGASEGQEASLVGSVGH